MKSNQQSKDEATAETRARCDRYAMLFTDEEMHKLAKDLITSKAALIKFHHQCLALGSLLTAVSATPEEAKRLREVMFEAAFYAVNVDVIMEQSAERVLSILNGKEPKGPQTGSIGPQ